ncbi:MAG: hypothetical protein ACJAZO_000256 [Myxococcota bacterium]
MVQFGRRLVAVDGQHRCVIAGVVRAADLRVLSSGDDRVDGRGVSGVSRMGTTPSMVTVRWTASSLGQVPDTMGAVWLVVGVSTVGAPGGVRSMSSSSLVL